MRQGDEGCGVARPASPSTGKHYRSVSMATSSTATRCRPTTEKALWELDGWIMGPIGHAAYPRNDPTWVMPPVRKKYELFAAVRPSRSYPNIKSIHKDVDIVFVRETLRRHALFGNRGGGRAGIPAERRHHRRHARHHPQGIEPRRARSLRDRAHAQAQEGHRRAQGAGLSPGLRHVRRGMPQGRARLSRRRRSKRR